MAVRIGSARIDENGRARGGRAGDQTGREVSAQNWYRSDKGWRVFRAKDPAVAEKIARCMQAACDNPHIGYDQNQRDSLYKAAKPLGFDAARVTADCETDCSALVRVCCAYAGVALPDIRTTSEPRALLDSGAFAELTGAAYTDRPDGLRRGDILCTRTQGHTVVVLSDGPGAAEGLRRGDRGDAVRAMQAALLAWDGGLLPEYGADGDFGEETEAAVKRLQRAAGLPETGVYDSAAREALAARAACGHILAAGDVNVRAEPGTDAPVIGVLRRSQAAPYLGETRRWGGRDWHRVRFGGGDGWVSGKYGKRVP